MQRPDRPQIYGSARRRSWLQGEYLSTTTQRRPCTRLLSANKTIKIWAHVSAFLLFERTDAGQAECPTRPYPRTDSARRRGDRGRGGLVALCEQLASGDRVGLLAKIPVGDVPISQGVRYGDGGSSSVSSAGARLLEAPEHLLWHLRVGFGGRVTDINLRRVAAGSCDVERNRPAVDLEVGVRVTAVREA